MNFYIEAYDDKNKQILGSLDGQGVLLNISQYKRTNHYKALYALKTLRDRVAYYKIVSQNGQVLETLYKKRMNSK